MLTMMDMLELKYVIRGDSCTEKIPEGTIVCEAK